jgi:hypothetical protein
MLTYLRVFFFKDVSISSSSTSSDPPVKEKEGEKHGSLLSRVGRRMTEVIHKMTTADEGVPPPPMEIGTPYNFQHIQHAKADPHTSTGFSVGNNLIVQ